MCFSYVFFEALFDFICERCNASKILVTYFKCLPGLDNLKHKIKNMKKQTFPHLMLCLFLSKCSAQWDKCPTICPI